MRKIKNGKLYDTETAKFVVTCTFNPNKRDFNYYGIEIYKKKTGEYFTVTGYYGYYGYTENLKTNVTEEEIKKILEKYDEVNIYIKMFGTPEE